MTVLLNVYLKHSLHLGCFLCISSSNTLIPKGFKQGFKHPLPAELPLPVQHSVHMEKRIGKSGISQVLWDWREKIQFWNTCKGKHRSKCSLRTFQFMQLSTEMPNGTNASPPFTIATVSNSTWIKWNSSWSVSYITVNLFWIIESTRVRNPSPMSRQSRNTCPTRNKQTQEENV